MTGLRLRGDIFTVPGIKFHVPLQPWIPAAVPAPFLPVIGGGFAFFANGFLLRDRHACGPQLSDSILG